MTRVTKVLVVDDEPGILHSTRLLLAELGFEVVTASEAGKVLPTLKAERPDILLQDVRMPGLDIHDLLRSIRKDPEVGRTPVLLFSASMDLMNLQEQVGAAGFLEKPFQPEELISAISHAILTPAGAQTA
ncbi:MAG TPA: response regulator [Candidatus Thermoplasmatota archaeon]|nr:response regulator [Candidatus Thermoplasmatota archaeon]